MNKYLCNNRKAFETDKEVYDFIRLSFPELNVDSVKGSYLSFLLTFFAYVCYPFTMSELSSVLGEYLGSSRAYVRVSEMLRKGYLKEYSFDSNQDMNSRKAYYLSSGKQEELVSMLPTYMRESQNKYRRTNGRVPLHDYGCGISLLQIMLLERPFSYHKEISCNASLGLRKEKGVLCIDAVIRMRDNSDEVYYIEQDTGTEGVGILVGKLYGYEKNGLNRGAGALIFSSHIASSYPKCPSFHIASLNAIVDGMEEEEIEDLYEYYECIKDIADEKIILCLKALMLRTGAGEVCPVDRGAGAPVPSEQILKSAVIRRGRAPFYGIDELRSYIRGLSDGSNEYRMMEYNRLQFKKARARYFSMCNMLCSYIRRNAFEKGEIKFILSGFPCIFYPTVLLSNSFDYLLYKDRPVIEDVLSRYFKDVKDASFYPRGYRVDVAEEVSACMSNVYELSNGTIICVEHIGINVSAFVRFYYLYYMRRYIGGRVCLIGVGTRDDILSLCEQFVYYPPYGCGISSEGLTLCFINEDALDEKNTLCVPYKKDEDDVILVDIVNMEMEESLNEKQKMYDSLPKEVRAGMSKIEIAKAMGLLND